MYKDELCKAMSMLAEDERTIFIGQGVRDGGTFQSHTITHLPEDKRIEFPVAENFQMGASIGMALNGMIPVTIFPRWNFMIAAADQLVNHLEVMQPHVIVRVGVGSKGALDPGPQHIGNWAESFRLMMPNTPIIELNKGEIVNEYRAALEREGPTILVEFAARYQTT